MIQIFQLYFRFLWSARRISLWNKLWHQWVTTLAFRNAPWPPWSHASKFKSMKLWRGFIDFRQVFRVPQILFSESSQKRWVVSFFFHVFMCFAIEARKYFLSLSMTSPVFPETLALSTGDPEATGDVTVCVEWSHKAWSPGLWMARSKSTWSALSGRC